MALTTFIFKVVICTMILLAQSRNVEAVCSATGVNVTANGFVMDNLCIQQGFLINNPKLASLQHPEGHSVECLLLQACIDSKYTILRSPASNGGNYSVQYDLGADGTAVVVEELKKHDPQTLGLTVTVSGIDDGTLSNGTRLLQCVTLVNATAMPAGVTLSPPVSTSTPPPGPIATPPPSTSGSALASAIGTLLSIGVLAMHLAA